MKKLLVLLTMVLAAITSLYSAEYQYVPMVQEGVKWVYAYHLEKESIDGQPPLRTQYIIEFKGDTVINDLSYKKCYKYFVNTDEFGRAYPCAYVREQDKRVYAICNEEFFNEANKKGLDLMYLLGGFAVERSPLEVRLLYDFGDYEQYLKNLDDALKGPGAPQESQLSPLAWFGTMTSETINIDGSLRNKYSFGDNTPIVIEGVGIDNYHGDLLSVFCDMPTCICDQPLGLSHVEDADGRIIYKGYLYDPVDGVSDIIHDFFPADGRYYDLTGRPVAHPEAAPGIYIHNGKLIHVR